MQSGEEPSDCAQSDELPSDCAQSGELSSVKLSIGWVTARYVRYRAGYCAIGSYRTIYAIQKCIVMIMMTIAMLAIVAMAMLAIVGNVDVNDSR